MIKKLVRDRTPSLVKENETELIENQEELNNLYSLKVKEELLEIQQADHKDIMEFVDLIEVAYSFARSNGFYYEDIEEARKNKIIKKGTFSNVALNNLNPNNPSNDIYFRHNLIKTMAEPKQHLNNHFDLLHKGIHYSDKEIEIMKNEASLNAVKEIYNVLKAE